MPQNTYQVQKEKDELTRHPIHRKTERSDENQRKKYQDNSNSPLKSKFSNTDDEVDDPKEENENNLYDRDGALDELQNKKRKRSEKEKQSHEGNEVKTQKKHLSDLPRSSTSFWLNVILIVLAVVVGLVTYLFPKSDAEISFNKKLENMKDNFQDQNHLTFHILERALKKVVNATEEPSAPAIFTVTVNKNAIYKSHEFSRSLAKILAPQNTVWINETDSWRSDPDAIKLKIDNEIQSAAKSNDLFLVIVDNLQNVPPKGAMIFHSYCDHEAAPFKQAVFLFIVPLDDILPKESISKKIDRAAFKQLKNIWHYASSDEIDSLITRITVNVINIS